MVSTEYNHLPPEKQQFIDAAIYVTEAYRIIEGQVFDDERDCFFSDPKLLVDYLRGLYALDMGTRPPLYFNWRSQGPELIQAALQIQQTYSPAGFTDMNKDEAALLDFLAGQDGIRHLGELLKHLDNMPYPDAQEQGKSGGRPR